LKVIIEFELHQMVQARWTNGHFYDGEITKVNPDATFSILFRDGDELTQVKQKDVTKGYRNS
jgi:hypothetical protein